MVLILWQVLAEFCSVFVALNWSQRTCCKCVELAAWRLTFQFTI